MKRFFGTGLIFLSCLLSTQVRAQDTLPVRKIYAVKAVNNPIGKVERIAVDPSTRLTIFGEYKISGYAVLSKKTPSTEELNGLVGTVVRVDTSAITGPVIDPVTFSIYEVERLRRDDYIFRVFGREIKAPEPDLPESFIVHKTDNENCYGIVDAGNGRAAIPYKGVLLYLTRN